MGQRSPGMLDADGPVPREPSGFLPVVLARPPLPDPRFDVVGRPHLASSQHGNWSREVLTAGDLVHALPANPAEPDANLMSTHQTQQPSSHETNIGARQPKTVTTAGHRQPRPKRECCVTGGNTGVISRNR